MKININKSAKRVMSFAIAIAMFVGTLFVANVSIDVSAQGDGIVYWSGDYDNSLSGGGTAEDPYLITNAEELAALADGRLNNTKYYKISGVKTFYMFPEKNNWIKDVLDYSPITEIKSLLSSVDAPEWPSKLTFEGVLDGNGATIYGMAAKNVENAGLFASLKGGTVKNLIIEKSYFSATNNAGAIAAQGSWGRPDTSTYSPTNTIIGCVVRDCYIEGSGTRGGLLGNGGYSGIVVDSCLVADNFIGNNGTADAWSAFVAGSNPIIDGTTINVPTIVSNSIGVGVLPKAGDVNNGTHKEVRNCYTTMNISYPGSNVQLTSNINADTLKGINAKNTADALNWATDAVNGPGYWHVIANDYPTPLKPEGWQDIIVYPVWDGTAAQNYAGGTGTAEDPYIIETAEQLYKMVKDGGRIWNDGDIVSYIPAYYKVANGVTDIYLNNVQGGDLDTLKNLVSAKSATNWTKGFNADDNTLNDLNNDGFADENAAFIGVFDGNGVTIHGLYSTTEDSTYVRSGWTSCSGIGFVPALSGKAVIKNVNFDKSYIYSRFLHSAVLTTSFGLDNNGTEKYANTDKLKIPSKLKDTANVSICNISVRNAYVESATSATWTGGTGGIVASHNCPSRTTMVNCLFDGYSSEIKTGGSYPYYDAGLFSGPAGLYGYRAINCVSLGIYPMPNNENITLNNIRNIGFTNSYTDISPVDNIEFVLEAPITVTSTNTYTEDIMPLLNWGIWSIKAVENGRQIPMPGVTNSVFGGTSSFKDLVLSNVNGAGNFNYIGAHNKGEYGQYHKLIGSGTESDPYLIHNASELATAIASGGVNISNKLHYKLTTDINLGSLPWIDTLTVTNSTDLFDTYHYVPFEGVLDGDGHAIYELNATAEYSGALIPELNGGTVKNLHLYNSAAGVAMFAKGNGNVENCSATNCYVVTEGGSLVSGSVTAKNSIFNDIYYLSDGSKGTPTLDGVIWYGITGKKPQLVNRAISMPCADVDGDGVGESYGSADLVALKNKLLKKQDYKFTYADVNGDGKVNTSDLVILIRATATDYTHIRDGFWRNLELKNFKIYYGENDNYDAARKLELYLESSLQGLDIIKAVSADKVVSGANSDKTAVYRHKNDIDENPDGELDIIVGNVKGYSTELTGNDYAITYDKETGVLWLQGANFTAVEQAVLDFVKNSDAKTSYVYTVNKATLLPDKHPKTINGTTYYYTWGDEFDGVEGTIEEDIWEYSNNITESVNQRENGKSDGGKYMDMEMAFNDDLYKLFTVENGILTMRRGVYLTDDVKNIDYDWDDDYGWVGLDIPEQLNNDEKYGTNSLHDKVSLGTTENAAQTITQANKTYTTKKTGKDIYVNSGKIITQNSLLVKQGYFEFKASLPSDGHSFPAWWMMGNATGNNNNAYSESLYGKIYKLNSNYTSGNAFDPTNFTTSYKYQLPNAFFEIDIIELMQDITNLSTSAQRSRSTGIYDYNLTSNIHKYYNTYAKDNNCYIVNWNTGTKTQYMLSDIDSTSEPDWIVSARLNDYYFAKNTTDFKYNETGHNKLTAMRRYGFEWTVTGNEFEFSLYIYDPDGDGESGINDYTKIDLGTINYNEGSGPVDDLEVANQYLYFLIDNKYYTANQYYQKGWTPTTTLFTDLLTKENNDKTTFEIDYLRVYQKQGRRDIVTAETESFNNGNHFGY